MDKTYIIKPTTRKGLTFEYREETTDWMILDTCVGDDYESGFKIEKDDKWLDIGAHIGAFSVYAASICESIISIEPIPSNFDLLERNFNSNLLVAQSILINKALVTSPFEKVEMETNSWNMGGCSIYGNVTIEKPNDGRIFCPTINISEVLKMNFDCVKIDAEGLEFDVIPHLDLYNIKKIAIEFHHNVDKYDRFEDIMKLLDNNFNHRNIKVARLKDVTICNYWK